MLNRWGGVIVLSFLIGGGFSAGTARAAVAIGNLAVNIDLQRDGTMEVTQQLMMSGRTTLNWQVFSNTQNLTVSADGTEVSGNEIKIVDRGQLRQISSKTLVAKNWQLNYTTTNGLIRRDNRDQLFFKIFQEPGMTVAQTVVTFGLPENVDRKLLSGNVYAIGGVTDSTYVLNNSFITYRASLAGANSLMTVNASWPKSVLQLSSYQEARLALSNLNFLPWIVLGVSLPVTTLIVLLVLLGRQRRQDKAVVNEVADRPPSNLSPLIVGVLVNKKIYPEEIVAMLVDLCQRGYLVIVKKNDEYFLGKRRLPDHFLQTWESNILEQILPNADTTVSDKDLLSLSKQSLFSPAVRDAFAEIYGIITKEQYFAENPHLTRVKYKLIGLGFYFVGTVGLIWTAVTNATPYLLIPLSGTIILSWLILRLTPKLIQYTPHGNAERQKWLMFANFLAQAQPMDPQLVRNHSFERYLPYAVALNKTLEWARRFDESSSAIVRPEWFISYQDLKTADLAGELVEFTGKISKMLTGMRGPLVN